MCTRTLSLGPFFFSLLECLSDCSGVGSEIAGVLHHLPPPSGKLFSFKFRARAHDGPRG